MKNLAIIPARSGSKGLPDKNIKILHGKPLLAYSVEAALQSGMFNTVHVSTDSEQYAEIAKSYGADVPFLRSKKNSSDTASSWDTVLEVLEQYLNRGKDFDNTMLLQPTSPLRTSDDITAAFALMEEKKANSIVSVCRADYPPVYYHVLSDNGLITDFIRGSEDQRRQDMSTFFRVNGAIFLTNTAFFLAHRNIYCSSCFAYIMDKKRSVDIDDELDFFFTEAMLAQAP